MGLVGSKQLGALQQGGRISFIAFLVAIARMCAKNAVFARFCERNAINYFVTKAEF